MGIESSLSKAFMARCAVALPQVRIFRRNVGVMKVDERVFKAGLKGQADMYAYIRGGRVVEIEAKSATGRLRPEQEHWRDWCRAWEIPWILLEGSRLEFPSATVMRWTEELKAYIHSLKS